jgi:hypothetical protein
MMVVKMVKLKTRLPDLFYAAAPALPAFEDGTSARVEFYARAFFWVGNFVYSRITLFIYLVRIPCKFEGSNGWSMTNERN